jgi:hypothetical protein
MFFSVDYAVHVFLKSGLYSYYGIGESTEVALVGHSHLMLGVNKQQLETNIGKPISKYTREGVNVADRQIMIDQLLANNPKTKYIIYAADAWMFTGEGLSSNSYKLFLPFMENESVDSKIKREASTSEYLQSKLVRSSRYSDPLINGAIRGHLSNWSNYKLGTVDTLQLAKNIADSNYRKIESTPANKEIFEATIRTLKENNIQMILVYVPTISYYNKAEPKKFQNVLKYFQEIEEKYENVKYIEYIDYWEDQHELFFDPIHMNPKGQKAFTKALSDSLNQLLQ